MSIFDSVFKISNEIYENSKYVKINDKVLEDSVKIILDSGKDDFLNYGSTDPNKFMLMELVADSINYCYWYGYSQYRPNGNSASKLYKLIDEAFVDYGVCNIFGDYEKQDPSCDSFPECIEKLKNLLIENRFTMLEERFNHLDQLTCDGEAFIEAVNMHLNGKASFDFIVESLLGLFPGYASDLFLKRASLFFINVFRKFGFFTNELNFLPLPADYQVPKVLYGMKILEYSYELEAAITHEILIPKSSRMEIEIRSASILVCQKLCELTKWNISDIDSWLWCKRDKIDLPFHLCLTTDY